MSPNRAVIVIGGGAAGMVAAIAAARRGAAVTILERMGRVGKKLLATGNGRCNLTNAGIAIGRYHGEHPEFARRALERFGFEATLDFFADLGIAPREEESGKVFPRSGQASAVLDVLRHELERLDVETRCENPVVHLAHRNEAWKVTTADGSVSGAAVVLAAGGKASPQLGSNGSGYDLVRAFGHRLVEPFPALTRIRVRSPFLKHLMGVKVEGMARLTTENQRKGDPVPGEVLFTETGLSGPPILDLSRRAGECLRRGERVAVELDLCPEIPAEKLPGVLRERFIRRSRVCAEFALVGFLNKRLIAPVLKQSGISVTTGGGETPSDQEIRAVAGLLKGWRFDVAGVDSWTEAQVTAGGIDTSGIIPDTLESRFAPGLFFAGEILDIDGDCGGFNLQWAWSSGHTAGEAAAKRAAAEGA